MIAGYIKYLTSYAQSQTNILIYPWPDSLFPLQRSHECPECSHNYAVSPFHYAPHLSYVESYRRPLAHHKARSVDTLGFVTIQPLTETHTTRTMLKPLPHLTHLQHTLRAQQLIIIEAHRFLPLRQSTQPIHEPLLHLVCHGEINALRG